MKKDNVLLPVCFGSIYLLTYLVLLSMSVTFHIALLLLLFSPLMLVWLVIAVLRDRRPSRYHFEERWYEDQER